MKWLLLRVPITYYAQVLSLGGSALLTFGTAMIMTASGRGELAIFMIISSLGSYFLGLGLPSQILQKSARHKDREALNLLYVQVPIAIVLGTLGCSTLIVFDLFPFVETRLLIIASASAIIGSVYNSISWMEYGRKDFAFSTALRGLIPLGALALSLPMFFILEVQSTHVAVLYLIFSALALSSLILRQVRYFSTIPRSAFGSNTKQSIQDSLKYFGLQMTTMLLNRLPVLASGAFLGAEATAVISIAVSLSELQASLPQMRSAITFTEASEEQSRVSASSYYGKALVVLAPGTAVVIVAAAVFQNILPTEYSELLTQVLYLTPGIALMAISASAFNLLVVKSRYAISFVVTSISIITFLAVILVLPDLSSNQLLISWSLVASSCGLAAMFLAARLPHIEVQKSKVEI